MIEPFCRPADGVLMIMMIRANSRLIIEPLEINLLLWANSTEIQDNTFDDDDHRRE